MLKFTFLVFLFIKIASGYYEELPSYNNHPSVENSGRPNWPVPVYYGEQHAQRKKPCPHRRSNSASGDEWVATYKSMATKPLNNNILEPQALKNENVQNTADDDTKVSNNLPDEPSSNENNATSSNPNEASNIDGTNRRSNVEESPNSSDELSLSEDYDCDIDLGTEDYNESQYGRGQFSEVASGQTTAETTHGIEQKVIGMLKDCINKKQKYIEDKLTQQDEIPIAGSRRSMGDSDIDHENDDSESVEGVDTRTTTDTNEKTTDVLPTNTDDNTQRNVPNVPDKVKETPSLFTLRPSKLFNELQNPAKVSGIADVPLSRRMSEDGSRVCYACSSATNPSCWEPHSKTTTVKYCRMGQNCVTKSFGVKNSLTVLRDCAASCDATSVPGIEPKYKSCSVCHKDLCNSAATNSYNLIIIFIITAIKCTF